MFSLLLLVSDYRPHKSWKKSFLSDLKWRRKFKMVTNFQWAVTFFLLNIFSITFLHFVCVENRKKSWKKFFSFWLKMAPLARGVGQKWFFGHNFENIQLFFVLFFVLVLRNFYASFVEESIWKKS
jgi:hypothetical protein